MTEEEAAAWQQYPDACGDTLEVPRLLVEVQDCDPDSAAGSEIVRELYTCLCHSGSTVAPATEAAIPILVAMVERDLNAVVILEMIAAIAADGTGYNLIHCGVERPNPFKPGEMMKLGDESKLAEEKLMVSRILNAILSHRAAFERWSADARLAASAAKVLDALERRREEIV